MADAAIATRAIKRRTVNLMAVSAYLGRNCISRSLPPTQTGGIASTTSASGYHSCPMAGSLFHVATAPRDTYGQAQRRGSGHVASAGRERVGPRRNLRRWRRWCDRLWRAEAAGRSSAVRGAGIRRLGVIATSVPIERRMTASTPANMAATLRRAWLIAAPSLIRCLNRDSWIEAQLRQIVNACTLRIENDA